MNKRLAIIFYEFSFESKTISSGNVKGSDKIPSEIPYLDDLEDLRLWIRNKEFELAQIVARKDTDDRTNISAKITNIVYF